MTRRRVAVTLAVAVVWFLVAAVVYEAASLGHDPPDPVILTRDKLTVPIPDCTDSQRPVARVMAKTKWTGATFDLDVYQAQIRLRAVTSDGRVVTYGKTLYSYDLPATVEVTNRWSTVISRRGGRGFDPLSAEGSVILSEFQRQGLRIRVKVTARCRNIAGTHG